MDITKVNGQLVFTHSNGTSITVNNQFLDDPRVFQVVTHFANTDLKAREINPNSKKENQIFVPLLWHRYYMRKPKVLSTIDKLFPFVDMLDIPSDALDFIEMGDLFKSVPKGYLEFCKRKGMRIYGHSYNCFIFHKLTENFPLKYRSILREVHDSNLCQNLVNIDKSTDELISFAKAFINSTKKAKEVVRLESIMCELNGEENIQLDETKTLQENFDIFKAEERKADSLAIRESQLPYLELEKISFHGLRVVVPLSLEELEDEGKQQSNCVGSFYNTAIWEGECIIYFIRAEDKPEKSYITCRYDFYGEETEEARARFNSEYEDERVDEIIKQIDEIMKNWE